MLSLVLSIALIYTLVTVVSTIGLLLMLALDEWQVRSRPAARSVAGSAAASTQVATAPASERSLLTA